MAARYVRYASGWPGEGVGQMVSWDLSASRDSLRRAASEPDLWPSVLGGLSEAVGGAGALLFCVPSPLATPLASIDQQEMLNDYLSLGWQERDARYRGIPTMERRGVITDVDCMSEDEIKTSDFYQDFLDRRGYRWFAGVGFRAGTDLWCLSFQRRTEQGAFQPDEIAALASLWRPLSDAAALSRQFDLTRARAMADALDVAKNAAFVCDSIGRIICLNSGAEKLIGPFLTPLDRTVCFADPASRDVYGRCLRDALDESTFAARPAVARLRGIGGRSLLMRAVRMDGIGKFLSSSDAMFLVMLRAATDSIEEQLKRRFGLSPGECDVALKIARGASVREIAQARTVKPESVRTQLKAVYRKTGVSGQTGLVLLAHEIMAAGERRLHADWASPIRPE